jgi:DNA-binding GntR family transcriptional regulator
MQSISQDQPTQPWSVAAFGSSETLQERVAAWLRGAILSGHFAPGNRLIQSEIAEHLKISITPVREAMRDLAVEGMLTLNPRRGITVRAFSPSEVQEFRMLSAILERKCGELIAERMTGAELRHARHLERAMATLTGLQDYYVKNNQFTCSCTKRPARPNWSASCVASTMRPWLISRWCSLEPKSGI